MSGCMGPGADVYPARHLWRSFRLRAYPGAPSYYRGWRCERCGEPGFGVPR